MRILVVGGTGFLGRALVAALRGRGDAVVVATRRPAEIGRVFHEAASREGLSTCGTSEAELAQGADGAAAVVNLAGAGIFDRRWTEDYKQVLRSSRIDTTGAVARALGALPSDRRPRVLVNASAVGYYGDRGDEELDETSSPGRDFLAQLCVEWEEAARSAEERGVRVTRLRTGIVFGRSGSALQRMALPFRFFAGGPVGTGQQWTSWIHVDDVVGVTLHAVDAQLQGALNATAPEPARMADIAAAIGRVLRRPSWLPVPTPLLRLAVGEVAEAITASGRVLPKRLLEGGYAFRHPSLEPALRNLL